MENINSVCFVGRVEKILPMEADNLEQVIISGWECVVQKGSIKENDLVALATVDAVIPFKFAEELGITKYLKNRKKYGVYTVKTTKLRGVYSQATIVGNPYDYIKIPPEGTDMMKHYGITKFEEPEQEVQTPKGKKVRYHKNPNFHVYHKFPNAKNAPEMFTPEDIVVVTRKIHGTNARYGIVRKEKITLWDRVRKLFNPYAFYQYVYGSHTVEKGGDNVGFYGTDVWATVANKYYIKNVLWRWVKKNPPESLGEGIIIYGEIFGPNIQKYYTYDENELKLKLFDIKVKGEYVNIADFIAYCSNELNIPYTEVLYYGPFDREIIEPFLQQYIGRSKVPHEGVVVKHESGSREKIAKFISPLYNEFQSKKEDSTDFH